jgi:O-antigen/teichoic acid export membrane protein
MVGSVVAASVNTALNILLIPRWGLAGCAWATTAAYAASLGVWIVLGDERSYGRRLEVLVATLPAAVGAALIAAHASAGMSLTAAATTGAVLAVVRRRHVGAALTLLRSHA